MSQLPCSIGPASVPHLTYLSPLRPAAAASLYDSQFTLTPSPPQLNVNFNFSSPEHTKACLSPGNIPPNHRRPSFALYLIQIRISCDKLASGFDQRPPVRVWVVQSTNSPQLRNNELSVSSTRFCGVGHTQSVPRSGILCNLL